MAIVSHRPIQDASLADFKLHHYRQFLDFAWIGAAKAAWEG